MHNDAGQAEPSWFDDLCCSASMPEYVDGSLHEESPDYTAGDYANKEKWHSIAWPDRRVTAEKQDDPTYEKSAN